MGTFESGVTDCVYVQMSPPTDFQGAFPQNSENLFSRGLEAPSSPRGSDTTREVQCVFEQGHCWQCQTELARTIQGIVSVVASGSVSEFSVIFTTARGQDIFAVMREFFDGGWPRSDPRSRCRAGHPKTRSSTNELGVQAAIMFLSMCYLDRVPHR